MEQRTYELRARSPSAQLLLPAPAALIPNRGYIATLAGSRLVLVESIGYRFDSNAVAELTLRDQGKNGLRTYVTAMSGTTGVWLEGSVKGKKGFTLLAPEKEKPLGLKLRLAIGDAGTHFIVAPK
jgi:hypothetical protein